MTALVLRGFGGLSGPLPFMRWRFAGFGLTLALTLLTFAALAVTGLNLGLDFTGGVLVEATASHPFDAGALRAALAAAGQPEAVVQLADGGTTALIRVGVESEAAGPAALSAIRDAFGVSVEIRNAEVVGPKVSNELFWSGGLACLAAVAMIAIYVWFRFEAKFGLAAFLTTFHDVIMIVGLFAVTGLTFDLNIIAAMLAIAGYSINDTVVVFDRIRENLARDRTASVESVIDRSVTETLRRTMMTSGTTLAVSVTLMLFGGPVLFGFAAAVTFGILVGTYSSIFVAAPLVVHLPGALPGRREPKALALEAARP